MNLDIFQNKIFNLLIQKIYSKQHEKEMKEWEGIYGKFDKTNYDKFTLTDLPNESTFYFGEIIKWTQDIRPKPKNVLLAGESNKIIKYLQSKLKIRNIHSAGLLNADFKWNFEENPPQMNKFDLIISQAVLEHLLSPYKHIYELTNLLATNGHLIIHTVCSGHPYHRHPIDTLRFYPDWFEETAKRLNLIIIKKRIKDNRLNHMFYMFKKPKEEQYFYYPTYLDGTHVILGTTGGEE